MNRLGRLISRLICAGLVAAGIVAAATLPAAPAHAQPDYIDCTVDSSSLKLRDPKSNSTLATLDEGTSVQALARNAKSTALYVKVPDLGRRGWIDARSVSCNDPISSLAVAEEQTSGTRYTVRYVPTPGAGPGDLFGVVYADGDYYYQPPLYSQDGEEVYYYGREELTFRDSFSLGLFVYDPREGGEDGDGIDHVEFSVYNNQTDEDIYADETPGGDMVYQSEGSAPYCLFSNPNGSDECNVVQLGVGDTWPGTDQTIEPGAYQIQIQAFPKKSYRQSGNWNLNIILE